MRPRSSNHFGRLLSLILAFGIAVAVPSTAAAQFQPWTTVGSAGTLDENGLKLVTFDGPTAVLTGFLRGGVIIRYNVVAVDDLMAGRGTAISMLVRYRATPDTIAVRNADSQVIVKLIEVNLFTGVSTTKLTLDSDQFPASNAFQTQTVKTCPSFSVFDFHSNAYYIEALLGRSRPFSGNPAIQAIQVTATGCEIIS
ncbi:MAG TPA: hypothetical protein VNA04_09890 [Thermoanaerobaculia bacterium]|nr:hypothetical protein [Thermoanaerobaculia bacterium]